MKPLFRFAPIPVLVALLIAATSCAKKASIADTYFAAAMAERAPYRLPGVSGHTIRSYEVVQSTSDLVVVRVTFAGKLGNDIVRTKKFAVVNGQLRAVERADIHDGIKLNLLSLCDVVDRLLLMDTDVKDITYEKLLAEIALRKLTPVAKENYSDLRVVKGPRGDIELCVGDGDGETVVLPFK